jgi:hypothetical protein
MTTIEAGTPTDSLDRANNQEPTSADIDQPDDKRQEPDATSQRNESAEPGLVLSAPPSGRDILRGR